MTRVSFNQSWTVRPKVSIFAQLQPGGAHEGKPVTLPHDAIVELPRSSDQSEGARAAYFPGGAFEYAKTFDVPADFRGKRVSLEFQGVYRDAMVYVNGDFAAQRPYGYSTFVVPLDEYLQYGGANTIRVDARAHDDSRWYTGVGIYRDTTLIVTDLLHIASDGVRISTPDIDAERAVVEVATTVRNDDILTKTVTIATELSSADGQVVARDTAPVTLRPGALAVARQRLYVLKPVRWSVDHPSLYRATTRVRDDATVLDELQTPFGIRSLQVDPIHGLRINGETVKLRGACIHHDNGPLGAAAIGRAEERRVELLKAAGFNAIRSAHNPISQAMLDACDRVGMLVMDETFDVWAEGKSSFDYSLAFSEWWERDIEAFVMKDFNHPSVILYSIGNEIPETGSPLGSELGRRLAEKVRSVDSTRFVTNGINGLVSTISDVVQMMHNRGATSDNSGVNDLMGSPGDFMNQFSASPMVTEKTAESFSVLDVAGMNYNDSRYVLDRELFPNRVILGTETFPPHIAVNWRLVEDNPHVIGDFTWTGWDYLGEVGIGRMQYRDAPPQFEAPFPWLTAWCGDIDITGYRRPASYYRETVFGLRHQPYIAVQRPETFGRTALPGQWAWSDSLASWSWNTAPGSPIRVEVYSDAEEVELRLNGRPLGRLPAGREQAYRAQFDITYEPGELVAVAYTGGVERARTGLRTAAGPLRLSVAADRTRLRADAADLSFVAIELRDAAGTLATEQVEVITVEVEGAGVLSALGSGQPATNEPFTTGQHTTFDGRLLAIVRPTAVGAISVRVSAQGLEPVQTHLDVVAPTN